MNAPASKDPLPLSEIERFEPFGPLGTPKTLTLPPADIRPTIRLAHQNTINFALSERIIFDYLLVLHVSGKGIWQFGEEGLIAGPRHLLLIPPFLPHAITIEGSPSEHLAVHFDWKPRFPYARSGAMERKPYVIRLQHSAPIPRHQVLTPYDPVLTQMEELVANWGKGGELPRLCADAQLFHVLTVLMARAQVQASQPVTGHEQAEQARMAAAIAHMHKHLGEPLTPDDMAAAAGLSCSRFSYLFRKWTGHSPMAHLTQLRIHRAKELLGDIRLSVKEVAAQCGFKDPYYFSKVFARLDGLPPTQFRETMLAAAAKNHAVAEGC